MGIALNDRGLLDEAIEAYQKAIVISLTIQMHITIWVMLLKIREIWVRQKGRIRRRL